MYSRFPNALDALLQSVYNILLQLPLDNFLFKTKHYLVVDVLAYIRNWSPTVINFVVFVNKCEKFLKMNK